MKTIILAHISSNDQAKEQLPSTHITRLTEYATANNLQIEHTFTITEASALHRRKQLDQIVALIRKSAHPIALITDTVDRLQCSFRDVSTFDDLRKQGRLELHFLKEGLLVKKDTKASEFNIWDMKTLLVKSYIQQLGNVRKRNQQAGH